MPRTISEENVETRVIKRELSRITITVNRATGALSAHATFDLNTYIDGDFVSSSEGPSLDLNDARLQTLLSLNDLPGYSILRAGLAVTLHDEADGLND